MASIQGKSNREINGTAAINKASLPMCGTGGPTGPLSNKSRAKLRGASVPILDMLFEKKKKGKKKDNARFSHCPE